MPTDLDKLQGTWNITALETDGQPVSGANLNGSQIIVTKNKFKSVGMGAAYAGTVEINEFCKPKTLDLVFTSGPEKGARNLGIYKFAGSKWILCLATRGTKRPEKFATSAGSGFALETMERNRPEKNPTESRASGHSAQPLGPPTELEGEWAMVSAVFNGARMEESAVKWCRRITRGDITSVVAGPQVFLKARFTLDSSKDPKGIDYINLEGSSAGKRQAGIFELTPTLLKICMSAPGQSRPTAFSSKPGDGRSYTVWRRT